MKLSKSTIMALSFLYPIAHFLAQYAGARETPAKLPPRV